MGLRSQVFVFYPPGTTAISATTSFQTETEKDDLCGKEHDDDRNKQKIVAAQNLTAAIT